MKENFKNKFRKKENFKNKFRKKENFKNKFRKLVSTFFEDGDDSRIDVKTEWLLSLYDDIELDFLKNNIDRIYNKYIFEGFNIKDDDIGGLVMDESGTVCKIIDVIDDKAVYDSVIIVMR